MSRLKYKCASHRDNHTNNGLHSLLRYNYHNSVSLWAEAVQTTISSQPFGLVLFGTCNSQDGSCHILLCKFSFEIFSLPFICFHYFLVFELTKNVHAQLSAIVVFLNWISLCWLNSSDTAISSFAIDDLLKVSSSDNGYFTVFLVFIPNTPLLMLPKI